MSKHIPLTRGYYAVVDDADYDRLTQWKWSYHNGGYACRAEKHQAGQQMILMHRALLSPPADVYVDHINGNRLDNRRCNLRIATPQQSACNTAKTSRSGYRGVTLLLTCERNGKQYLRSKPWVARIRAVGRHIRLGYFASAEKAARAYDEAAIRLHGEFAKLNFPEDR